MAKQRSRTTAMLCSLFVPGLGQLYKRQFLNAIAWALMVVSAYIAFIPLGALLHLCCVLGAGKRRDFGD